MDLTYDDKGNLVDSLEERNQEIKDKLSDVLNDFINEKEAMLALKKPVKLGYQFGKQLFMVLSSYGRMTPEDFNKLDYDTLNEYWQKYLQLTAYYNRYFEIVDNKQLFMTFMGINSRQYSQLENSQDEDIKNLMLTINGAIIGLTFMASESGNADSKATKTRLGAKDVGHSVISASEEMAITGTVSQTPLELNRRLKALGIEKKNK